ncbi:MAG: histidinol dehydrogenase [Sedimentisphaerales bacterium]|nr:histidinol dehydrogenase [Sedimentisphaerales bacterium]
MTTVTIVKTSQSDFRPIWQQLRAKLTLEQVLVGNSQMLDSVRQIVAQVRKRGDAAVAELVKKHDAVDLRPDQFRVSENDLQKAHEQMDPALLDALRKSIANVRSYQQAIKLTQPDDWTTDGLRLGVRYRPLERIGVCIPAASAPLVSTVIMTVVPAQVAGVHEVALISAPKPQWNNSLHPAVLGLCHELQVTDVYRVSGAQAVAALAFGTDSIAKVDKIVGPGNRWGQLAKKEVYGLVDIDSFAGPSEVLIIADDSARPDWIAADLLSQAEHAPGSAVLLTDSAQLADQVNRELEIQLAQLDRSTQTQQCLDEFCLTVITKNLDEAIDLANEFAVEHLQIQCRNSDAVAEQIQHAGAIFIGPFSPVATGDYFAGPSHTLPTGGSARFFSALNVNDFLKQSSIINYNESALKNAAPAIQTIAAAEGLDAHLNSVKIRTTKK